MYYLKHSAKGHEWANHKYIKKENGRYIYDKESSGEIKYGEEMNGLSPEQIEHYRKVTNYALNLGYRLAAHYIKRNFTIRNPVEVANNMSDHYEKMGKKLYNKTVKVGEDYINKWKNIKIVSKK